jgi:hypothetical protein
MLRTQRLAGLENPPLKAIFGVVETIDNFGRIVNHNEVEG